MDSTLPTINSQAEQDFINNLIVKYKMVENIWLDAGIKNKHIVWKDSSSGEYENWMTGHLVDDSNCVELIHDQANMGEWQDIPCNKKNAILCKRVVIWSAQRMERLIRDNRRLLNEALAEISQLKQSQVPMGFIYVQMPSQSAPKTLWPAYEWSDVTDTYAGQFFRADGGDSLGFNKASLLSWANVCGDGWDLFHDSYYDVCYKYVPGGLDDYNTVVNGCQKQLDSTLPTINSPTEQAFINQMIVKYQMVDNIWLDAGVKDKHIVWTDRSSGEYENWMSGRPVNDGNCVEMQTDSANLGKWLDVSCTKKNAYVCKRVIMWSDKRIERIVSDIRRVLDKTVVKMKEIEQYQVPIGFIYIQLPNQTDPKYLWPKYTWEDVTSNYAGHFFRAEGGGSLGFEQGTQSENAPRL
ncbi:unnamed protein product [Medioppia subpectinata]|uniref:C-type lectin domain-containing protein n=1 Tax=Medioppia subpectinata TaxID=1979941 RepID=A0A7R9KXW1_9ACAR|nr:unnamed protein product [Medioppia subpectinata]CAG2111541.1 unnamed protein product [Medioppia subpectinata]